MRKSKFLAVSGFIFAAACSGGGGGSDAVVERAEIQDITDMSLLALNDEADRLSDAYLDDINNHSYTDITDLPEQGGATYTGVLGLGFAEVATGEEEAKFVGQIAIAVNFGDSDNQIDGSASNFFNTEDEEELTGSLDFDASIVDTTGQFEGNISGRLVQHDALVINIPLTGGFLGGGTDVIAGSGVGIIHDEDTAQDVEGGAIFAAE